MKIAFAEITREGIHRILDDSRWSRGSGVVFKVNPVAEFTLQLVKENAAKVHGTLEAVAIADCSRCGIQHDGRIYTEFSYLYRLGEDENGFARERQCSLDDCQSVFIQDAIIDLCEMAEEQLVLSLPSKPLCDKKCRGLCFTCGADLNVSDCKCEMDLSNSPFAVLKQLKK